MWNHFQFNGYIPFWAIYQRPHAKVGSCMLMLYQYNNPVIYAILAYIVVVGLELDRIAV